MREERVVQDADDDSAIIYHVFSGPSAGPCDFELKKTEEDAIMPFEGFDRGGRCVYHEVSASPSGMQKKTPTRRWINDDVDVLLRQMFSKVITDEESSMHRLMIRVVIATLGRLGIQPNIGVVWAGNGFF